VGFKLDRSWIKTLYTPKLQKPILLQGISHSNQVTAIVTRLLLEHLNPTKFAECYSPYFPDYVIAEDTGLCSLLRCIFHVQTQREPNIILVTGDSQLLPEGAYANYEVFSTIVNYAKELGCTRVLSYGGFTTEQPENSIYIAATSGQLTSNTIKNYGGKIFSQDRLVGPMGLILGLAHIHGLKGVCVLKPLADTASSEVTALSIFNYVLKVIEPSKRELTS
jgi:proteasome assembly chaperone (PAC2) family protein